MPMIERLKPHFTTVQAHYDLSDDFFRLFLDPALGKLGLQPGMTLRHRTAKLSTG